jgi:hypothetical protein
LFGAAAIYAEDAVEVTGDTRTYIDRTFCPDCGSPVFSRTGSEIELHLGAFDAPEGFVPSYELWTERRPAWLPAFPGTTCFPKNRD